MHKHVPRGGLVNERGPRDTVGQIAGVPRRREPVRSPTDDGCLGRNRAKGLIAVVVLQAPQEADYGRRRSGVDGRRGHSDQRIRGGIPVSAMSGQCRAHLPGEESNYLIRARARHAVYELVEHACSGGAQQPAEAARAEFARGGRDENEALRLNGTLAGGAAKIGQGRHAAHGVPYQGERAGHAKRYQQPGEIVGIIGRNGAGKSTLLKVLSRITEPTTGEIRLRGRVASLLEVGTGFHPELTGRENIYINGSMLGMSKKEVDRVFDDIVDFSELEEFIDGAVRFYSSGMYVRLGFAVAVNVDPDVLVIDEVLAVGDMAFQDKCLGKMGEVSREGRTVIFVSHNMHAVNILCPRVIMLRNGQVYRAGPSADVIRHYLEAKADLAAEALWEGDARPGSDVARLN